MAVEELLLYFVVIPSMAYAGGAIWVRRSMRRVAEHELGFLREPGISTRYLVIVQVFATPVIYGLLVLFLLLGIPEGGTIHDDVVRYLGWAFATGAAFTVYAQASILVRWRASSFRENFTRVLVLATLPEVVILLVVLVAFQIVARLNRVLTIDELLALGRASGWMLAGTMSAPLSANLANGVGVLTGKTFVRALLRASAGTLIVLVCTVFALLELASV